MKKLVLKMPHQTDCIIETNSFEIVSKLNLKYGKYIAEFSTDKTADIKIIKGEEAMYDVIIEDTAIHTSRPIFYLDRFLFEHPTYDENIFAMHGAAVCIGGKSYAFLGATTGGKTTLTSYLTSCGFSYLTDDCVLLDRQTLEVHPFATPLHLREGGVEVLKKYDALPNNLEILCENDEIARYTYTPENSLENEAPLGEIFFIERTESENAVLTMSATEKLTALLKSPITVYPMTSDYLKFLSDLSKSYCKRLKYCDMNFVKEVIKNYAK